MPNKTERFIQRLILLGFTRGTMMEIMAGDCEAAISNCGFISSVGSLSLIASA